MNGVKYTRHVDSAIPYGICSGHGDPYGSLIDGGTNGGLLLCDARIIEADSIATAMFSG